MTRNLPGQRNVESITPRNILLSDHNVQRVPGGGVLDATYCHDGGNTTKEDELRPGIVLAKITATNLWAPCKRTTVSEGFSGSGSGNEGTSLNVVDARHFQVDDTITVVGASGSPTGITVSAVDYVNNVLTLATAVDNPPTGGAVYADNTAGIEIPRCILNEFVDLQEGRKGETTKYDKSVSELIIQGLVDDDLILGDLAAIRALTPGTDSFLEHILWGDRQGA